VAYSFSEETPDPYKVKFADKGKWVVTFDPLDGSSIISNNWTIGAIVAIWPKDKDDQVLIGKTGRYMSSACCCCFGSRTSVMFYNEVKDKVEEYTLMNGGSPNEYWVTSKTDIKIRPSGKIFSPGNTRCVLDNPPYREVVDYWIHNGYTLRYSGGMAADIYQIFIKGEGVFSCMGTDKQPSKLRFLYEVAPYAFLIEKAGG
jgi:sedoheptulose-bisphosphatase